MIPSELMIDGVPWTVADCDTLPDKEWGETNNALCRILLSTDLCEAMKEMTFWHELVHALFGVRDFKLHPAETRDESEEEVAAMLGPALCAFFKANADITWRYDPPEIH